MCKTPAAVAVCMGILSIAQDAHTQDGAQFYAGVEIMNAFEDFDVGIDVDDSIALGAQLGVRSYNEMRTVVFGGEVKAVWYDGFDFVLPGVSGNVDAWAISVRPKVWFPVGRDFKVEPYVFGGVGWADADAKASSFFGSGSAEESDWFWEFGGGVEFPILEQLAVFTEAGYVNPVGDLDGAELWTLGIGLNFRFSGN